MIGDNYYAAVYTPVSKHSGQPAGSSYEKLIDITNDDLIFGK